MKIARLLLIAICSLSVYCSFGQTNEDVFAKYFREEYNATTWGLATNGIQFGVQLSAIGPSAADKFKMFTYLNDTNSTSIYGLWKLPPGYRFEKMILKTKAGEEIKKTSKGNALCKSPFWNLSDGRTVVLNPKLLEDFDEPFDPRDCFKIKKAGSYILTVKARLYAMKSYNEFVKLDIPEVSIEVKLPAPDSEN
jgi:hypothetical protein